MQKCVTTNFKQQPCSIIYITRILYDTGVFQAFMLQRYFIKSNYYYYCNYM